MKKALQTTFTVLVFTVLFGRMLSWVLHFNEKVDQMISIAMFTLIGIAYLVVGFVWNNRLQQIIVLMCGAFLILMNCIDSNVTLDITGIVCILVPMLIARFSKEKSSSGSIV